jgi:hypothetical protein
VQSAGKVAPIKAAGTSSRKKTETTRNRFMGSPGGMPWNSVAKVPGRLSKTSVSPAAVIAMATSMAA